MFDSFLHRKDTYYFLIKILFGYFYSKNLYISLVQFFHRGSWSVFIVTIGAFSPWQLERFYRDDWSVFTVAVGRFSFGKLADFRSASWTESILRNDHI